MVVVKLEVEVSVMKYRLRRRTRVTLGVGEFAHSKKSRNRCLQSESCFPIEITDLNLPVARDVEEEKGTTQRWKQEKERLRRGEQRARIAL